MIFQNHECLVNRPRNLQDESDTAAFDHFDSLRASIEMLYGRHKTMFPIFGGSKRLRLMNNGFNIVHLVLYSFLVSNCYTCMKGSAGTSMFDIMPPTIKEYLPLDEILTPGPIVALPVHE